MNHQLHPLEINPKTGEPFLRLRRHKNIIITPPRWTDAEDIVPHLNDPLVYEWLSSPPYPYTLEDGKWWLNEVKPRYDRILQELQDAKDDPALRIVNGCPVQYIREVREDGTDALIGDIEIGRTAHGELMGSDGDELDWENKQRWNEEHEKLPTGHPDIVWEPGYWLASSHHGQGIMPDALETVMQDWFIPRAGARRFIGCTFLHNEGSRKVFEKNGFRFKRSYEKFWEIRGKERGLNVLEYTHKEDR